MKFILDTSRPLAATYFTEDGMPAYRIGFAPGTTGIFDQQRTQQVEKMDSKSGHFLPYAEYQLHSFRPDRLKMGTTFDEGADSIFRREWGAANAGDDRIFVGLDDKEYRWKARMQKSELVLNDGSDTLVAKFHRKRYKVLWMGESRPASFDILPAGEHMVDLIMFTYAYVERKREQYQEAQRRRRRTNA
ncbi:hypothetical protein FA15DRAFT_673096 [Coprinopsis marcescibilis]|uniref:DUF6593 domain-containing protein n=1 Tax=Coprinopsis marcescibilis TaxID=230819 RepID=A0A5C3KLQ1_COPMA|nr:hypothetical protein FA15DRAFT_673096 [Coprinopsis marcescibilis]